MTDKNERTAWIKQKGRVKTEDTKGEIALHCLLEDAGFDVRKPQPIGVNYFGEAWTLTPDREVRHDGGSVCLLVQGVHHQTEKGEVKSRWELMVYRAIGVRALMVEDQLLFGRYRNPRYVLEKFVKFLLEVPDRMLDGDEKGAYLHA